MAKVRLGRTGIITEQNAFGALPIQRISFEAAGKLLNRALDGGKIGRASCRERV